MSDEDLAKRRAGRAGERIASEIIEGQLRPNDFLLTNVVIRADGKETELDNLIINERGVFIIEVKTLSGQLLGEEDDREWTKIKVGRGGNIYREEIRNPIRQVDREIYILSRFLKSRGFSVWIEGYVYFVERNSPIHSQRILENPRDIDYAIHHGENQGLGRMARAIAASLGPHLGT